jgi:hypothetical protein
MNEWMNGIPPRCKDLLVGYGVKVESEDQVRSMHPPHSYPYPKVYCALSSSNSSCHHSKNLYYNNQWQQMIHIHAYMCRP